MCKNAIKIEYSMQKMQLRQGFFGDIIKNQVE